MCTLTLAWQCFDGAPIAVAANRDEALGRESAPPELYGTNPAIIAPSDRKAGGTWIGVNECGVFVGITNKWNDADLDGERSRGLLVADALEAESATEAGATVERETANREYEGFYLVIADGADAYWYAWDGECSRTRFEPGVHVVVNAAVDGSLDIPTHRSEIARTQAENARTVRRTLEVGTDESVDDWLERAGDVLGDHEYGVCLHRDGFGTRSSSLLAVGDDLEYRFASGPPCRTGYDPVTVEWPSDLEGHI